MAESHQALNIVVQFPGLLLDSTRAGEGKIRTLSADGCTIQTSDPLPEHAYVQLRLIPDAMDLMVLIELAAVRSVQGQESRLDFLTVRPDQRAALERLLQCTREER
jgi:hypothetical protein